jgi:Holliday junction resolvase RusA-like endonuclease
MLIEAAGSRERVGHDSVFVDHTKTLNAEMDSFWPSEAARIRSKPAALVIRVPGDIRGKGRPKFSRMNGGRAYTDAKTVSAENWVKACAVEQVGQPCLEGPLTLSMSITVAIPPSWSKRKQAEALAGLVRPTGKPDLDNTAKLVCDALNKLVWQDDSQIVGMSMSKQYGTEPGAMLEVGTA